MKIKDGTIKTADQIDWAGDFFGRTALDTGFYVMFGMWKGPFDTKEDAASAYREWVWEDAASAYREWAWEAKHS